jgi:hypothetical protein
MKSRTFFVAVVAICIMSTSPANAYFQNGNEILAACAGSPTLPDLGVCVGYIDGIADAMEGNTIDGYRACIPFNIEVARIKETVVQFLLAKTKLRQLPAAILVADALGRAFPCH